MHARWWGRARGPMLEAGEWGSYFHPFVRPCDFRYNVLWCKWEVWVWGLLWICSHPHLPFLLSTPAMISGALTRLAAAPFLPLFRRPDRAVETWGLTGREGSAGTGWHGHIWWLWSHCGWQDSLLGPCICMEQPWGTGELAGLQEGHHMESVWVFYFFFFVFWDYQNKRSKKRKKEKGKENFGDRVRQG